jgi:hypothetical protein
MIKYFAASIVALGLAAAPAVFNNLHNHDLCDGFVEENDLHIPVNASFKGRLTGISEVTFNQVLDKVEALYSPIVKAKGATLTVNRKWSDGTVNAYAQQFGQNWQINMFGGLARHQAVTADGFALVACHELGHHLGGAPKVNNLFSRWASNEGASDYFASLKCLRLYFDEASNVEWYAANASAIPSTVSTTCTAKWSDDNEAVICMRSTMAGYSVANLFQDLRQEAAIPSVDTPDQNKVATTSDTHPATQCRLDTYYAGALCDRPIAEALSDSNYRAGSCAQPGYTFGFRPLCWFKP